MNPKTLRLAARVGVDALRARVQPSGSKPPILLNALPKSGTHLLITAVERLPDVHRVRLQISRMNADVLAARPGEPSIPGGVAAPLPLSPVRVRRWLRMVPGGAFATAHMPWSERFAEILDEFGMRTLLMFRDPRDIAVSAGAYIARNKGHPMHRYFAGLSESERITAALTGVQPGPLGPGLVDIRSRVTAMLPWLEHPGTLLVRFEDLVGPDGGGSRELQRTSLDQIAKHVGSTASPTQLAAIGDSLFGGSATFRSGQIGTWRADFTEEHRRLACELLDDVIRQLGYPTIVPPRRSNAE